MTITTSIDSFEVWWNDTEKGFGSFYFYVVDNEFHIDNECMSKDYIKKVLCSMVDNAILDDEPFGTNE